jgi:hypothetical protein
VCSEKTTAEQEYSSVSHVPDESDKRHQPNHLIDSAQAIFFLNASFKKGDPLKNSQGKIQFAAIGKLGTKTIYTIDFNVDS